MAYTVLSFSGGKDSTAMLFGMLEKNQHFDEVVFFDTGWEFPQMYEHIKSVERESGIKITKLHSPKSFEYLMFDHVLTKGKRKGTCGYGWPRPNARWCTTYKTMTIDRYLKSKAKEHGKLIQCIGIAYDEQKRIKDKKYPLIEWKWTEQYCLDYCYWLGFDWGGLYETHHRVSCWCCPLQDLNALRSLYMQEYDLWEELQAMEDWARNTFRIDYSVDLLAKKFLQENLKRACK